MLNFDRDRFIRIQSGAAAQGRVLFEEVGRMLDDGADRLHFVGSGGAGILMEPAARLLQDRSCFQTHVQRPAELVLGQARSVGPGSVVVVPSLSGTTDESLEAARFCRDRGARVLTLTGSDQSPLAQLAHVNVSNPAADDTSCESFYIQSLCIALAVLSRGGELPKAEQVLQELAMLPELLAREKDSFESQVDPFVRQLSDNDYHIVTGAGATWPEAFYYGMCILEEMQWIRTRPVHASDFFHGTLELVEPDVSLFLLKGEDVSRTLTDRVERFARGYSRKVLVLDTFEASLPGVSPTTRSLISPIVLATLLERVSAHLEVAREHPLTTRRYYRRVSY